MDVPYSDDDSVDDYLLDNEFVASYERQSLLCHSTGDIRTLCKGQEVTRSTARANTLDLTETEEIWGELEDDASVFVPPSAVKHASPVSTIRRVHSGGDGGFRDRTAMSRGEREEVRVESSRGPMPASQRMEPTSPSRFKFWAQEPLVGWWRWQWWRRRPKDDTL